MRRCTGLFVQIHILFSCDMLQVRNGECVRKHATSRFQLQPDVVMEPLHDRGDEKAVDNISVIVCLLPEVVEPYTNTRAEGAADFCEEIHRKGELVANSICTPGCCCAEESSIATSEIVNDFPRTHLPQGEGYGNSSLRRWFEWGADDEGVDARDAKNQSKNNTNAYDHRMATTEKGEQEEGR